MLVDNSNSRTPHQQQQVIAIENESDEEQAEFSFNDTNRSDVLEGSAVLVSDDHVRITARDYLNQIRFSKGYWIFYLCMITVTVFMLLWSIIEGGQPRTMWFVVLEGLITFTLCLEVSIRLAVERSTYFRDALNVLDLGIATACLVSFLLYAWSARNSGSGQVDTVLLTFRYATQLLRLFTFYRHQKKFRPIEHDYVDLQIIMESPSEVSESDNHSDDTSTNANSGSVNSQQQKQKQQSSDDNDSESDEGVDDVTRQLRQEHKKAKERVKAKEKAKAKSTRGQERGALPVVSPTASNSNQPTN